MPVYTIQVEEIRRYEIRLKAPAAILAKDDALRLVANAALTKPYQRTATATVTAVQAARA